MEKYLVTIAFNYSDAPKYEGDYNFKQEKITIGIYDTFNEACTNGNNLLEFLESKFELHQFPDGSKASKIKNRFSKNGGCFGGKHDLITNLAYLKTPFNFSAKIVTLKYKPIDEVVNNIIESVKRYRDYELENQLD